MKRNRKYNKEIAKETFMNGLRHIVILFLGIGILIAQDPPEEFQFNQSNLQAFYYFNSVTIDGDNVHADDWVGAFKGDICVGARKWDTSLCGSGVCDVPVFGNDGWPETEGYMNSGDIPTFKIYIKSENRYYDALATAEIPWVNMDFNTIDNLNGVIYGCSDSNACNYDADATMNDGSCLQNDCADECGGTAELDECGTCDADSSNDCVQDCDGNWGGSLENDECGVCGGDGIADDACDCAGNVEDCAGECGGSAEVDECGTCDADSSNDCVEDCNGDWGGTAELDECGTCDADSSNDCVQDCDGNWGGSLENDECGVCGGDGIADDACDCAGNVEDCAGECGGSAEVDECGVCGGDGIVDDACDCAGNVEDCAGECGGSAEVDECGVCGGDNSSCSDCDGVPNGDSEVDNCGTCDNDPSNDCLQDCTGDWGGTAELDECDVCGGDNSSCSGCMDSYALNFDAGALVSDGSCEYPVYGCLDETALNYDPEATNSNGNCDYPPEVGIWFGNIDADAGSMEIYSSSDSDLDNISFSISGATITGGTEGSVANNNFTLSGSMNPGSGLLTVLSFTDGGSEYCLSDGSATAAGYDSVNITLGGCSVLVGLEGGVVVNETGGVDIPEGALSESENIAVGDVTEELPEEVDNATGFEVEELVAFTPFDLVFEVPVEISVSSTSQSRDSEYLCYLEDANDTEWAVVDGANCTDGTCIADVMEFGIFATCVLVEDCNDDLGGFAYLDDCGECVGENTGNVANYTMDECGLCDGPGYIEWYIDADGDNLGYGDGVPFCSDVVPDGYVPNNDDTEPYCATNDTDECGLCGGNGSADGYNCEGNCIAGYDCEGICGGNSVKDDCDICGGNQIDGDLDDDGDNCETECTGDLDCNGVCNGNSIVDSCGVCNGSNTCAGCDDVANSGMVLDDCGECGGDGIVEGACDCEGNVVDCMGVCGGSAPVDACDICNGPGASTWYGDSDGDGLGNPDVVEMSCVSPDGFVPNDDDEYPDCGANYFDCTGECGGSAVIDECGVCGGDNSSCSGCTDSAACNYNADATIDDGSCLALDCAGVCGGDGSSCGECGNGACNPDACDEFPDCTGECGGSAVIDECGVCDGNNDSCWYIDIAARVSNEPLNFCTCPEGQGSCVPVSDNQADCESGGGEWGLDIIYVCADYLEYNTQSDCEDNGGTWDTVLDELELYSEDLNNRIGMHAEAIDGYNDCGDGQVECVYNDIQDLSGGPEF